MPNTLVAIALMSVSDSSLKILSNSCAIVMFVKMSELLYNAKIVRQLKYTTMIREA
jgi:hypothetical protein